MTTSEPKAYDQHVPVMLAAVLETLAIEPDGVYVDATFGRGGHSRALLERLAPAGRVFAFDRDPQSVAVGRQLAATEPRFAIEHGRFSELARVMARHGLAGKVNGILFDLGVSSPQLDDPLRGFGFRQNGPLDMRMDPSTGISAGQWLAEASEKDIAEVLKEYGEERHARRIARAIVARRTESPLVDTQQLAALIAAASPSRDPRKDPATRSFQAIRIFINRELDELRSALAQVKELLTVHGRLVVISFHSLEDRIVKHFIRDQAYVPVHPVTGQPQPDGAPRLEPIGKAQRPTDEEIRFNPRARSAILRCAGKVPS